MAAAGLTSRSSKLVVVGFAVVCFLSLNSLVSCSDPDGVLDFCVALLGTDMGVWQTGTEDAGWMQGVDPSKMGAAGSFNESDSIFPCKATASVTVNDFVFPGLGKAQKVKNKVGSLVTKASVLEFPGLNTLHLSSARVDFEKNGLNPPHVHPRATEVLFVLEGCLLVGFVDTNNTLFQQNLEKGDVFVFPKGMLHFEMETGVGKASAFASFDSQNPGTLPFVEALLESNPAISEQVVETAFHINQQLLGSLVSGFSQLN